MPSAQQGEFCGIAPSAVRRIGRATCPRRLQAFEIVERLQAIVAPPLSLAGSRPELADPIHFSTLASGAGFRPIAFGVRRNDAVLEHLSTPLFRDPVGSPRRRDLRAHVQLSNSSVAQRPFDVKRNDRSGRAAGIGWRQDDFQSISAPCQIAHNSKIDDRHDRNFRIRNFLQPIPYRFCCGLHVTTARRGMIGAGSASLPPCVRDARCA